MVDLWENQMKLLREISPRRLEALLFGASGGRSGEEQ